MLQLIISHSVNLMYDLMSQGVEHNRVKYLSLRCSKCYTPLMPRGDLKTFCTLLYSLKLVLT